MNNNNNKNVNNYINNNEHSLFAIDQSSQSKRKNKVFSPQGQEGIKVNRLFEKNDRFPLSSLQLGQKMRGRIISIVE